MSIFEVVLGAVRRLLGIQKAARAPAFAEGAQETAEADARIAEGSAEIDRLSPGAVRR